MDEDVKKMMFIYLYKTKFNNKEFGILWNKKLGYYPIENVNGKSFYPEYDSYIEIYKYFQQKNQGYISYLKDDWKVASSSDKNSINRKKIFLKPLVRLGSTLISAWMALSMAGCTINLENEGVQQIVVEDEIINNTEETTDRDTINLENDNEQQDVAEDEIINNTEETTNGEKNEKAIDEPIKYDGKTIQEIIEDFHKRDYDVEYNYTLKRFIIKKAKGDFYPIFNDYYTTINVDNQDELRKYFPNENQNPTFEDVHNGIDENPNIPLDIKEQYHFFINRLKEVCPDIDLFTLNMNVKTIKVNMEDKEYNPEENYNSRIAQCIPGNQIDYHYSKLPIEIVCHELSHNIFQTVKQIDKNTVANYDSSYREFEYISEVLGFRDIIRRESTEGLTNVITLKCSGKEYVDSNDFPFYITLTDGINTLLNCCGITLDEYSKMGYITFLEKLTECGISDPVESISDLYNLCIINEIEQTYSFFEWRLGIIEEVLMYQIEHNIYDDSNFEKILESVYDNDIIQIHYSDENIETYSNKELRRRIEEFVRQNTIEINYLEYDEK